MDWTMTQPGGTSGPRWTLDDDPRYVVERRSLDSYAMLIDGRQVDDASTPATAMYILELRYEAEVYAAAFELARLRLGQAEERITSRFPSAARDGQLASLLSSLGDALGAGPEAADLDTVAGSVAGEAYRQQVSPELAVTVDPSQCIVLEVSDGQGRVLRRVTVTHMGVLKQALNAAYDAQQLATEQAEQARLAGRDERRRAEGRLTRSEAVEWLIERGHSRGEACAVTRLLHAEGDRERAGMTYDGTYWRISPAQEAAGV